MIPNILSIAGSDPSGGAGIQADIKAISARGGYAMAVITALTAQNTRGVQAVEQVAPAMLRAQIAALRADIRIDAVKIGMLGSAESAAVVADELTTLAVPLILDPVMVAKGGNRLLSADAVAVLRARLLPLAALITPNLPEAADLLATAEASNRAEMQAQAEALLKLGPGAVLLKGGHLAGEGSPDLLLTREEALWLEGARHTTANTHGTGCTLSSAIATELAHGCGLAEATAHAKAYVAAAIAAADQLDVGHGHGPTHHFHAWAAFRETP